MSSSSRAYIPYMAWWFPRIGIKPVAIRPIYTIAAGKQHGSWVVMFYWTRSTRIPTALIIDEQWCPRYQEAR